MRRNGTMSVALFALVATTIFLQATSAAAQTNKPVKVKANCPNSGEGKFSISVDPFEVIVAQGENVEWQLDSDKNMNLTVTAKNPEDWLYSEPEVKGNGTVVMTGMAPDSQNKTYEYSITVYCGDDDTKDPVVLDPRIRVGGG